MRKLLVLWLIGWALFGFPWGSFTSRPRLSRVNTVLFRWGRRRDQLLNFLYYIPFGIIGGLLGWPGAIVPIFAALLSGFTEFLQVFSTDRFPSATDLVLNAAGAVVGIALVTAFRQRMRVNVESTGRRPVL
jgi:VanZ family protein